MLHACHLLLVQDGGEARSPRHGAESTGCSPLRACAETAAELRQLLAGGRWDAVIIDPAATGIGVQKAVAIVLEHLADLPVIIAMRGVQEAVLAQLAIPFAGEPVLAAKGAPAALLRHGSRSTANSLEGLTARLDDSLSVADALRRSEERLHTVMETMPVGAMLTGPDGRVQWINSAAQELLGVAFDQLGVGYDRDETWDVIDEAGNPIRPSDLPSFSSIAAGMPAGDIVIGFRKSSGGDRVWAQGGALPLHDAAGAMIGVITTFTNVTELHRAEAALRASEARLRAQYEGFPISTFTWQRQAEDFVMVDCNRTAENMIKGLIGTVMGAVARELYADDHEILDCIYRCWNERRTVEATVPYHLAATGVVRQLTLNLVHLPPDMVQMHVTDITDRVKARATAARHVARLSALRAIDAAITASPDLQQTLSIVLKQVCIQLGVDAARVLLLDSEHVTLEGVACRGFRGVGAFGPVHCMGAGGAGRAALECRRISILDLQEGESPLDGALTGENFASYFAAPLIAKGEVKGVLELFQRSPQVPDADWLEFFDALASQAAIAVDNAALFADLQRSSRDLSLAYDTTIEGWSRALDLRDRETEGHSRRVTEMTVSLARRMGISGADLVHVRRGALLHDIGKMGIPDGILLKPGPLTDEEWVIMRKHPVYAFDLLTPIAYLHPALDIPYCHHERWDGTGYPRRLRGEAIPFAARIFAVADVWDALRSDRPYRPGWDAVRVHAHVLAQQGTHFDPAVIEAFTAMPLSEYPQRA